MHTALGKYLARDEPFSKLTQVAIYHETNQNRIKWTIIQPIRTTTQKNTSNLGTVNGS